MDLSPDEKARTVIISRVINAPADDVFDAYANPAKIVRSGIWSLPATRGISIASESLLPANDSVEKLTFSLPGVAPVH